MPTEPFQAALVWFGLDDFLKFKRTTCFLSHGSNYVLCSNSNQISRQTPQGKHTFGMDFYSHFYPSSKLYYHFYNIILRVMSSCALGAQIKKYKKEI